MIQRNGKIFSALKLEELILSKYSYNKGNNFQIKHPFVSLEWKVGLANRLLGLGPSVSNEGINKCKN